MSIDKREDDGPIIDKKDFAEDSTTTDLEGVLASVTEGGTLTQRELWGWWIWGWGAIRFLTSIHSYPLKVNGFGGSAQGVFIPVILSSLAVAASFRSDDPSQPCAGAENCIVRFGTMNVSPASFSLFNQGLAIAFQVVTFIQLGAIGDHGNYRKHLLFGCSLISQICCLLFIAVDSTGYQLAGIINIIANVFWGASWVFATSYLPLFAMLSPQVKRARQEGVPLHELVCVEQEVMSHISGRLTLIAYTGGTVCFLIAAGAVLALRQTTYSLQVATAIGGGWWVIFGAVSWFLLTSRPSPPLPAGENYLTYPWKRLYRSLKTGHRLPDMTTILIANFFFSDARHTTISLAVLFAQFELVSTTIQFTQFHTLAPTNLPSLQTESLERYTHRCGHRRERRRGPDNPLLAALTETAQAALQDDHNDRRHHIHHPSRVHPSRLHPRIPHRPQIDYGVHYYSELLGLRQWRAGLHHAQRFRRDCTAWT
ncbi:vacuole effluxer Atg22 like-domain-containing protein [Jimgerdemannia flammicorona]|uniref:Autophagy-related protein n=1 Tax=Jimgerdemannia flammicorona TaxID=994334 RepID=A0A433D474_9FUNG|nr:vacuole effluxer Atg22 like-domain-containing protein [Jimgerdemannia flammicorona]